MFSHINQLVAYNEEEKVAILRLKVKPAAKADCIQGVVEIDNKFCLKISIKAPPREGKANKALIDFLSQQWNLVKNNIEIINGHSSTLKSLAVKNIDMDYLKSILNPYIK